MKELCIGLVGCAINNPNMGCVALTYSLLQLLNKIQEKSHMKFSYIIFERNINGQQLQMIKQDLDISNIKQVPAKFVSFHNFKYLAKTVLFCPKVIDFYRNLSKCDVVIDLTEGDSFTDFYQDDRFYFFTRMKEIVEKKDIPLILGPQTYGPFYDADKKDRAAKVINNAYEIYSREETSADVVRAIAHREVISVTDLAFQLKYQKKESKDNTKIKVGINPSGLLASDGAEKSRMADKMKTNYDDFIRKLVNALTEKSGGGIEYELHLIPHVGNEAIESFPQMKDVIYHKAFKSPVEAKNLISAMDVFVGSRMHATIAAFSSGVATIPVAYSDKFKRLFDSLGYGHTVDLREYSTEESVNLVYEKVQNYSELSDKVSECMKAANRKYEILTASLRNSLLKIAEGGNNENFNSPCSRKQPWR